MNEISARYSEMPDEFYLPELGRIQKQSSTNKQGSGSEVPEEAQSWAKLAGWEDDQIRVYEHYKNDLEFGLARELARINLPVSLYTEMYWQMNLHNLFHFLKLRLDSHAQWEIQEYARAIEQIVKLVVPAAYKSWKNHVMDSVTLSRDELTILVETLALDLSGARLAIRNPNNKLSKSRQRELRKKLGISE